MNDPFFKYSSTRYIRYHKFFQIKIPQRLTNEPKSAPKVFDSFESLCKYQEDGLIDTTTTRSHQTWHQTEFLEKVNNLFNTFISRQCTPTFNKSTVSIRTNFEIRKKLSSLDFCVDDIAKIIGSLDQSKAHDHDEILISIIKLCASLISISFYILFSRTISSYFRPETESFSAKNGRRQIWLLSIKNVLHN